MSEPDFPILSSTKVAALLDRYPELEDVLIGLAPAFRKLKNPFLRKGVAKVASLKQAAAVGGMPVSELVNKLRAVVGQEPIASGDFDSTIPYFSTKPEWFDAARIVASINERETPPDKMSIVALLQRATTLQPSEIVELITTFLPAPGIDVMKSKGFRVWTVKERPDLIRTYVCKPSN